MTESKQMGININYFITHKDNESITESEMDKFTDDLILLIEKYGWICGGGARLEDADSEVD